MKKVLFPILALVLALGLALPMAAPALAAPPTFTGDVPTDFVGPGILTIPDPGGVGDVGLPVGAPPMTISGWDMVDFRLAYDLASDTMYVGLNTFGIGGDADGDGLPGVTSGWLAVAGGTDLPDFMVTECFAVYFDLDQNGTYDVIAGVSGATDILTGFSVNQTLGIPANPAFNFGMPLPGNTGFVYASPSAGAPDVEFTITNFSTLPGQDALLGGFEVTAFMGSLQDDGIGEDFITYQQSPTTITTITPSAASVNYGESVDLTVTEENDGDVPLTSPQVDVTINGAPLATLVAPPGSGDDGNGILDPGETWVWTLNSGALTVDPTNFVATGSGTGPAGLLVTYPDDPEEQDSVPVEVVFNPTTITTISSSAPIVNYGESVDLTVTEENDGNVPLTSAGVDVTKNGAPLASLAAPPDSGDDGNNILDPGETWVWTISSGALTVNPTNFVATGYGTDPEMNVITYPGDPEEQDSVPVEVVFNPTTITTISSSAPIVNYGESVDLTVTEENDGNVPLTSAGVDVTKNGAPLASLAAPPDSGDDGNNILDPGETWVWTISSGALTVNPTNFVATGYGTDPTGLVVTFPDDPEEQDEVPVEVVFNPTTITTISSSAATVNSGDSVTLTVTEENDGNVPLTNAHVEVYAGMVMIADLDETHGSWSSDVNGDAILDPTETWTWTLDSGALTATTTFVADGYGTDPTGTVISILNDPDEEDDVTVEVVGDEGCTPGFWKNNADKHEASAWVDYSPTDSFETVFGVDVTLRGNGKHTIDAPTLLEALAANGGGINALARHATAALLNICNPNVAYAGAMNEAELIAMVQTAIAEGEDAIEALHTQLAGYNEAGCSVNQQGEPIIPEEPDDFFDG